MECAHRLFINAKARGNAALLPLLLAEDGDGIEPEDCGELDPENKGLEFVFTHCTGCRKRGDGTNLQGCSACVMVAYCGENCQRQHWPKHKKICKRKMDL